MSNFDFDKVAQAALADAETLVPDWLPQGKRSGKWEWQCGSLKGDKGKSLSVSMETGLWSDFATGEKGGDLISLYAAIFTNNDQYQAFRELARLLNVNVDTERSAPSARSSKAKQTIAAATKSDVSEKPKKSASPWVPVLPVPESASAPPKAHPFRGRPDAMWTYKDRDGRTLGFVCRFTTSDGGKEIAPLVYARDSSANGDKFGWRWMHFPEPRPLYGLEITDDTKPVLIVEGEKCRDAALTVLGDVYDVKTWSGGSNAVHKADWSVLSGRGVVIWPDTDSNMNKEKTEYLAYHEQPGMKAALKIAEILKAFKCVVRIIRVDQPAVIADGWDVFDAIAQGMDKDALLAWMKARIATPESFVVQDAIEPAPAKAKKGSKPSPRATAKGWQKRLLYNERGMFRDCRENVVICLENHPKLKGCIAYNAFTARVMRVKPTPWNSSVGEWTDNDDLELSDFLAHNTPVAFNSLPNIAHGVQLTAHRSQFHPLQEYLNSLEWDCTDRLSTWLIELLGVPDTEYARLIGPLWLRQAVHRALNPGCKADYVLILEGVQGQQKSSALRALGGEFFSDARLDLNNKDLYQMINGVWIHEIAELDAFNRSEANAIKAFITRPIDRYRLPYEKRMIDQARHTVFAGTTNNYEYHKDTTGNRRFWSVRCSTIYLKELRDIRDQLLAQAVFEVKAGKPLFPTRDEEERLIKPEQEMREIQDAWEQIIVEWLKDPAVKLMPKITTRDILLKAIGMEASKINPTRQSETKVGAIMHKLGWVKRRESGGSRGYYYDRPAADAERRAA